MAGGPVDANGNSGSGKMFAVSPENGALSGEGDFLASHQHSH
jgi:hypothetical protein